VRVEDLDRGRVRPGCREAQLADLRWLGLDWDEGPDVGGAFGPYVQSLRGRRYQDALERLGGDGRTYPCLCSRKEIAAAASAPHPGEEGPPYPGTCRFRRGHGSDSQPNGAALRFLVPSAEVVFRDELQGQQRFTPAIDSGDFVVRRKDAVAAYQLAVVVDDAAMEITHVLRGADLLSSTARQMLLYRALDLNPPSWTHVPLLLGADGVRLSKRHDAPSLRDLRLAGTPPEQVVGWLAASCNLAQPGEYLSPRDLLGRFDLDRVPRSPAVAALPEWSGASGRSNSSGLPRASLTIRPDPARP